MIVSRFPLLAKRQSIFKLAPLRCFSGSQALRNRTLMGTKFRPFEQKESEAAREHGLKFGGLKFTYNYLQKVESNDILSPWHDIELIPSTLESNHVTGVIEIPVGTTAKMELDLSQPHNPVISDIRKNKETGKHELRHYGMPTTFNYGFIPQTWEDGAEGGDNDPIDLVDLGSQTKPLLGVSDYVVLGCLGLVDQGEMDWKVLALEVNEAREKGVNTMEDYERLNPGRVAAIREWFRTYKTLEGKGLNEFVEEGKVLSRERTLEIIFQTNVHYRNLLKAKDENETKHGYWLRPTSQDE